MRCIKLANHDCSNESYTQVSSHEVCTRVLKVGAADCRNENENELENTSNHLDKECVQGTETKAFDDDRSKLEFVH